MVNVRILAQSRPTALVPLCPWIFPLTAAAAPSRCFFWEHFPNPVVILYSNCRGIRRKMIVVQHGLRDSPLKTVCQCQPFGGPLLAESFKSTTYRSICGTIMVRARNTRVVPCARFDGCILAAQGCEVRKYFQLLCNIEYNQ